MRSLVFVILLLMFMLPMAAAQEDMSAVFHTNIQRVGEECFNQGACAVIDEVFAETFISHDMEGTRELTPEDFKNNTMAFRAAIPDLKATTNLVAVDGNWAGFLFSMEGTFTNDLVFPDGSVPATGGPLHVDNFILVRADENGQVAEMWEVYDNLNYLTQLGVFPSLSSEEEMAAEEMMLPEMMATSDETEAANKETIMRLVEGINTGNLDVIDEIYTDDHVGYENGSAITREEGKDSIMRIQAAMPDLTTTIEAMVAEGNLVVYRLNITGTFTNELMLGGNPVPPTGEPVTIIQHVISVFNEDGQIAQEWIAYDTLSLLTQLGLLQMPE